MGDGPVDRAAFVAPHPSICEVDKQDENPEGHQVEDRGWEVEFQDVDPVVLVGC